MEQQSVPYACGRLGEICLQLQAQTASLAPLRAAGDKTSLASLARLLQGVTAALREAVLLLQELGAANAAVYTAKLCAAVCAFHVQTPDYTKLTAALDDWRTYIKPLVPEPEHRTVNAAIVGRMMNSVRLGYYPTDPAHIERMKNGLAFPDGKSVNLLDPCCGEGIALSMLADGEQAVTYGVELDEGRAEYAQTRLNRVALGSYYFARISPGAFHVLLLNPPYLQMHGGARSEKRFLGESYAHLMMGGVLFYIVPYYRLTEDVCNFLAMHFDALRVFRFLPEEFQKFRQIVVIGKRKPRAEDRAASLTLQKASFAPGNVPALSTLEAGAYALPNEEHTVQTFQGNRFNVRELSDQMAQLGSILPKQSALDHAAKHPPLPLTIGQIGLVGGSGMINGLIECDTPHVIKGRIIKEKHQYTKDVQKNEDGTTVSEIVETTSNKMVFNLLTTDGVKLLA